MDFQAWGSNDAKNVVVGVYNVAHAYFLDIIGAILAAGLVVSAIWWGYHKVKDLFRRKNWPPDNNWTKAESIYNDPDYAKKRGLLF